MEKGYGKGVFADIAYGKIYYIEQTIKESAINCKKSRDERMADYELSKEKSLEQLYHITAKLEESNNKEEKEIIEGHVMLIKDVLFYNAVKEKIVLQDMDTLAAVQKTGSEFAENMRNSGDNYMQERADDIDDITMRLLSNLVDFEQNLPKFDEPVIIVADNLLPSVMMQLDKSKILGIMTKKGSETSHMAIIARSLLLPTVVGCNLSITKDDNGRFLMVDGIHGECILDPDETEMKNMTAIKAAEENKKLLLEQLKGKENITRDGYQVDVFANIEGVEEVNAALRNDAGGIGLFRSEFLFLGRNEFPDETEQFSAYKKVVESMQGKKVVIRTLDIGGDKQAEYFGIGEEENPAMGMRAIRICLTKPEIFKTQLRAIYRASIYGNVSIMFPMIISVEEVRKIKAITEEVKQELKAEGIAFKEVELGIMIETPAAVMIAPQLAEMVDFFSVGTNDLTQYTLAIDRQNEALCDFYNAHHPAILHMLQMIADAAKQKGIWVGICGELAGDKSLTKEFIKMGYSELSVSPGNILELRDAIRNMTIKE